ncbi:MAG: alpha/beta hydrolase [Burkholderiaceae bacterium]|nr:alpha/beta hydrolase [Burkholderiaceae bacterium]
MTEFQTRRLLINGLTFNVVDQGQGEPVLLVHGFPDDHEVWRKQIPALLKAGYRVIAPDMRGCGLTDAPAQVSAYKLDTLVSDLVALLDALGITKVRLVGHDWGAGICWALCLQHPERVERYVALSVGHLSAYTREPFEQKLKGWYIGFFQLRGLCEWLLKRGNWRMMKWFAGQHSELAHWIPKLSRPGRLTAGINWYRANLKLLLGPKLPKSTVPTLGIWSDGDKYLVEAQMVKTANWMNAPFQYQRLQGASHWLQLDAPDAINRFILNFFK